MKVLIQAICNGNFQYKFCYADISSEKNIKHYTFEHARLQCDIMDMVILYKWGLKFLTGKSYKIQALNSICSPVISRISRNKTPRL